jgi:hypothetical protein
MVCSPTRNGDNGWSLKSSVRQPVGDAVAIAALVIGVIIVLQGLAGLLAPDAFASLVRQIQEPPVLYVAALVRVAFGVVLVVAATGSRAPNGLRALGALMTAGGLLTPFFGVEFARVVLGWWSEGGTTVVRGWAGAALAIGAFIIYATTSRKHAV